MAEVGAPPLDMSLVAPRQERLEQLTREIYGAGHAATPEQRIEMYKLAQMEQLVSAVGVLAQFCSGAR